MVFGELRSVIVASMILSSNSNMGLKEYPGSDKHCYISADVSTNTLLKSIFWFVNPEVLVFDPLLVHGEVYFQIFPYDHAIGLLLFFYDIAEERTGKRIEHPKIP